MIDVSELMTDPDFVQTFRVRRMGGTFENEGEFTIEANNTVTMVGAVQPANGGEKAQFQPQGDQHKALIKVYCGKRLRKADGLIQSDIIAHCGADYKVIECVPWGHNGYWKAIAEQL